MGGAGPVVDWVLRMAPVPAGDFLDVDPARFDAVLLDALGDMVAANHAAQPAAALPDPVAAMRGNVEGNARAALGAGLPADRVAAWREAALAALDRHAPLIVERAAAGKVRRVHGDLHLGNICLWRGAPVPFDAIEFDETMGTIDLGYDLAFLLMDLDHRVGRAAANRVLNRYVARTGDAALVRLLPPFLSRPGDGAGACAGGRTRHGVFGRGLGVYKPAAGLRGRDWRPARIGEVHAGARVGADNGAGARGVGPAQRRDPQTPERGHAGNPFGAGRLHAHGKQAGECGAAGRRAPGRRAFRHR